MAEPDAPPGDAAPGTKTPGVDAAPAEAADAGKSAAGTIAAGILTSRLLGFVREYATAFFFGVSAYADVFRAALRMPNVLQNLLGEGTISAAFIPIYSRMLDEGREEDAGRFAGAIFGLLFAVTAGIVLFAVLAAPYLVAAITPGFVADAQGDLPPLVDWVAALVGSTFDAGQRPPIDRYTLTVQAVRIIFPMTGVLVLSAWALGVLNSHRRFFLPYFAPVLWNAAIITALYGMTAYLTGDPFGATLLGVEGKVDVLFAAFFGALVGGALQFGVQLPLVFREIKGFRLSLSRRVPGVREAMNATGPVLAGRGAAQLSSYIDQVLASLIATGAIGALGFAQVLYLLPVSLFGMSVAASELPELSRLGEANERVFTARLSRSIRQIAFLTVPSFIGYLAFGLLLVMALFGLGDGDFELRDGWLVYAILAAYSLGLLATTFARLMQNSFWALGDTKTPAKVAIYRIAVSAVASVPLMFWLDRFAVHEAVGLPPPTGEDSMLFFGAVGIALGSALGAFVEITLLRRALRRRIRGFVLPTASLSKMVGLAVAAVLPAAALWWILPELNPFLLAIFVVGLFGVTYLGLSYALKMPELESWAGRFLRRLNR